MNLDSGNVILSIPLDKGLSKELFLNYHYKAPQNRIYLKPSRCYSDRRGRARLSVKTVDWPGAKQGRGNVIFTLILWITIKSDGDLELSCSKQQKKIGQKMLTFIMEKYFSKKMKWNQAGLNCQ